MAKGTKGLKIDWETADRITLANLKDVRKTLKKELENHEKGQWMHAEDVGRAMTMIAHLNEVIGYFGG